MPQDASAITQRREAQASLVPRAITRGSAAPTTSNQAMGERAAGPTAKRMTSPQLGAVAPERGRPKMATDPLPASAVRTTQGRATASAPTPPPAPTTTTTPLPPQHPGHRDDEDHGDDGRGKARRGGDDGAEDHDLGRGPAPPLRSGRNGIGLHAGRPGQPQRDEGEGGIRHQPVPTPQAERAVGQGEPEVTDDRHDAGSRRHQRAEAARDAPGAERDAPQEQDPLQGPHGAEEDGAAEADQPESGRGGRGGAHTGRLPAREEVVPAGRPGREGGELPDERQRAEEEIAGPDSDDQERDDDGHRALTPGGQGRRPDPAAETVPSRAPAQVVEVVEVRVLAEGRAPAPPR